MFKLKIEDRRNKIISRLKQTPNIIQKDLVDIFGISKSTISRDITYLSEIGAIVEDDNSRLSISEYYTIDDITFTSDEAFSLYTSILLMVDRNDYVNPNLIYALRKLSHGLERSHPHLSSLLKNVAILDKDEKEENIYTINLSKIIAAWKDSKEIQLNYWSRRENSVKNYRVGILDFTPYADGHGQHLVCIDLDTKEIRPFRFKRIKDINILPRSYDISNRDELLSKFNDTWKIWLSDEAPREVVLKFSKEISRRVLETRWHKNQITEIQDDGSLIWRCQISEPKEMEYWILGWGSHVEVLSPPDLRERITNEIKELAEKYNNYKRVSQNETGSV